ncbi:hypothetical protein [Bacillus paranthracis]|uniref:hypothetical protein n=1 Tax=Bacillus paranthracis TaxID=2026186 RepID=UPI001B80AA0A|nr:hypothetical protein [Bacillus paranthracis]
MEKRMANAILFLGCGESFPRACFLYLNLFFYVTTGEKLSGMRISFCRRISSARAFAAYDSK